MRKIIWIILLLFLSYSSSFSFSGELSLSEDNVELWEAFNLTLEIEFTEDENLMLDKIQGIESFQIVGKSVRQGFSQQSIIENWEVTLKNKWSKIINLTLVAKDTWNYTLGPVTIESSDNTTETNAVEIQVEDKQEINVSEKVDSKQVDQEQDTPNNQNVAEVTKNYKTATSWNTSHKNLQSSFKDNWFFKILKALAIASFLLIIAIIIIKLFSPRTNDSSDNDTTDDTKDINTDDDIDFISAKNNHTQQISQITLPSLDDEAFFRKAEAYFRNILTTKYNIAVPMDKTLSEIEKPQSLNSEKSEQYNRIISNFEKIKYSDILVTRSEIYNQIKDFTQ